MVPLAPRIPQRLLDEFERIYDDALPIADIHRELGASAARLGFPRPSYERVRQLVRSRRNPPPTESTLFVLYQTGRTQPPNTLVEQLVELTRSAR